MNIILRPIAASAVVLATLATLAACQRQQATPAESQNTTEAPAASNTAPAALPDTDASAVVESISAEVGVQPVETTIAGGGVKDFAGIFSTEGASLELKADGSYASTVHAASADAELQDNGTWTVEADGKELLLDSNDKATPDQRYSVGSRDEIKQTEGAQVLRREAR